MFSQFIFDEIIHARVLNFDQPTEFQIEIDEIIGTNNISFNSTLTLRAPSRLAQSRAQ